MAGRQKESELSPYRDHARNLFFGFAKMPSAGSRMKVDSANRVLTRAFAEGPEAADELARELNVALPHLTAPAEAPAAGGQGGGSTEAPAEPQGSPVEGDQPQPAGEPAPAEPAQEPAQRGATGRFGARRQAPETAAA